MSRYSFTRSQKSIAAIASWHSADWAGPGLFVDGNTIYWTGERTACPGSLSVRRAEIAPSTLSTWKSAVRRGLESAMTGSPCCADCGMEAIRVAFSDREAVVAAVPSFRGCGSAAGPFDAALREATGQMRQVVDMPGAAWMEVAPPAVRVGIPDSPGQLLNSYPNAPPPVAWPFPEVDLQAIKELGTVVRGELAARVWTFCLQGADRWPAEKACDRYAFVPVESNGSVYSIACAPAFW